MAQHNPLSVHADPLASKKEAWSGRFSEPMAEFVLRYTASVNFDKRMAEADIAGSVAHAKMLAKCGIISKEDLNDIERGMRQILQEIKEIHLASLNMPNGMLQYKSSRAITNYR